LGALKKQLSPYIAHTTIFAQIYSTYGGVFMSQNNADQFLSLASLNLDEAFEDFMLSRRAMQCSDQTLQFYSHTAGKFIRWLKEHGLTLPREVMARHVREFLAMLISQGKADTTLHDHARAIKTLLRFWHSENYIPAPVTFAMPKLSQKRLPSLSAEELEAVIKGCITVRDKAIVLFMADTGLRRSEVIALNWGDVDMGSGLVNVRRGKGGRARSTVVGAVARRQLLAYRRTLENTADDAPLFQFKHGMRLKGHTLHCVFTRLSKRTGIHVTAHAMRRTFGRSFGRLVNASQDAIY
jgi:site-specific recombinase XerD